MKPYLPRTRRLMPKLFRDVIKTWRHMESAPRDGTKVRLRVKDGFGVFQLKFLCCYRKGKWVNANTNKEIKPEPVNWLPVKRNGGYDV